MNIYGMFRTRSSLHQRAYQHKTTSVMEHMWVCICCHYAMLEGILNTEWMKVALYQSDYVYLSYHACIFFKLLNFLGLQKQFIMPRMQNWFVFQDSKLLDIHTKIDGIYKHTAVVLLFCAQRWSQNNPTSGWDGLWGWCRRLPSTHWSHHSTNKVGWSWARSISTWRST